MTTIKKLNENQVAAVLANQEFGDDILNSCPQVAVVLTQDWCPQWHEMQGYLSEMENSSEPKEFDLTVFVLEYNKIDNFDAFRQLKETIWKNDLIPYARYYKKGRLIGESNFVSKATFIDCCRD